MVIMWQGALLMLPAESMHGFWNKVVLHGDRVPVVVSSCSRMMLWLHWSISGTPVKSKATQTLHAN